MKQLTVEQHAALHGAVNVLMELIRNINKGKYEEENAEVCNLLMDASEVLTTIIDVDLHNTAYGDKEQLIYETLSRLYN